MIAVGRTILLCISLIGLNTFRRSTFELGNENRRHKSFPHLRPSWTLRRILQVSEIQNLKLNKTNQVYSPTSATSVECHHVRQVNRSYSCAFVQANSDCDLSDGFIQYIHFIYCKLPKAIPLALVILFVLMLFLFIVLGITADDYFCPSLTVISKTLRLSQNVAGVTFLAYGNGAPDIFSAIAAVSAHSKNPNAAQLGIQALFGAGIFVTTVVVGSVTLCTGGFHLNNRPFTRDVLFYLGAVSWMFITMYRQRITMLEAIGFIIFYFAYVVVVIVGRYVNQRWKRRQEEDVTHAIIDIPPIINRPKRSANLPPMQKLVRGVLPFTSADFELSGIFNKVFLILKAPAAVVLNVTIPVIDYDEPYQNWNKWLNVLHLITGPMFCVLATRVSSVLIGGRFSVWVLTLILCVVLALLVTATTTHNKPPRCHWVGCTSPQGVIGYVLYKPPRCHWMFGYLAFIVSVVWIYVTANEIVNILQSFGIVLGLSNAILGLTFLAWGNSIGDLVADTTMARQGFPNMATGACFGGPMLNLLLGVGISCTIASVSRGHPVQLKHRYHQYMVSAGFLAASLASSAIIIPLRGFRLTRGYGIYLLVLYFTYLTTSIVTEVKDL
ncbi:mitochondrial sodium/calcium exchanger protein isoform X2 [Nematostella vectensis]|uniref:mitochondrial sodium/calcium exchanger protein isoform X2 n=1 Tax=Nematostella vectensis TaxID=45351 RepID=UPI0020779587|nr:mitochondrial sodium/calcium exchanger protein isoform X2 [Nematostella vectensis]